jgi:hypothetical protein
VVSVCEELSELLNTGLTREQLELCTELIETKQISPDALVVVVNKLREIKAGLKVSFPVRVYSSEGHSVIYDVTSFARGCELTENCGVGPFDRSVTRWAKV